MRLLTPSWFILFLFIFREGLQGWRVGGSFGGWAGDCFIAIPEPNLDCSLVDKS